MPTNEERRLVAKNIRENYAKGGLGIKPTSGYNICKAIGLPGEPFTSQLDFWYRLADLIEPEPERTCFLIDTGNELCCSVCDCRYDYSELPYELPYCGGCGCKVIKNG